MAAFFMILPEAASGARIRISWNNNTDPDTTGYKVYYGTASRNYKNSIDAGQFTTVELDGLTDGVTYYFSVTAYDKSGNESTYSQEVQAHIPSIAKSEAENNGGGSCFMSTTAPVVNIRYATFFILLCVGFKTIHVLVRSLLVKIRLEERPRQSY